jgi:hypothetical protein
VFYGDLAVSGAAQHCREDRRFSPLERCLLLARIEFADCSRRL